MSTITSQCRTCGASYEPDRTAILAGSWRTCPICRPVVAPPPDDQGARCRGCGRQLRAGKRDVCLGCLLGGPPL
jgi:hypothetical protein